MILFVTSLVSCANIPSVPVCTEINIAKGYCVWTTGDKEQYVDDKILLDGKTWWDMRPTMVQVPADSWAKIKAFIIKICKDNGQCKQVSNWERAVGAIDAVKK